MTILHAKNKAATGPKTLVEFPSGRLFFDSQSLFSFIHSNNIPYMYILFIPYILQNMMKQ